MPNNQEVRARLIGGLILLLLGGWVLHSFLGLLVWAVVLAITTWPVYQRLLASNQVHGKMTWGALGLTLLIGAIILVPLGYGLSRLAQEAQSLGQILAHAQNAGISPPAWLETLPMIGSWAKERWMDALGTPEAANESLHWLGTGGAVTYTREFASQLLHPLRDRSRVVPRSDSACVFTKRFLRSENAGFPTSRRVICVPKFQPLVGLKRGERGRLGQPQALAVA
jgi:predicted PurR-regulated permease PerM